MERWLSSNKQQKTLSQAIGGRTTVESCLQALYDGKSGIYFDPNNGYIGVSISINADNWCNLAYSYDSKIIRCLGKFSGNSFDDSYSPI